MKFLSRPMVLQSRACTFFLTLFLAALCLAQSGTTQNRPYVTAKNDALTRSGFDHYYELDYDGAIHDFERTVQSHPDDPFAVNHLLAAVFFKELYQAGAMESNLYASNSFLNNKTQISINAATDARIKQLTQQAIALADARLKINPHDAEGYYARGVTQGLQSTYTALVQKSWFSALGSAKSARKDHEKALELDPNYTDARLIPGIHAYIVGSLPWPVRVLAHVVGESGNKKEGLREMYTAGDGGGDAAIDAKVVLALFLRREQRFTEALALERTLTAAHPRNFLFALEEANILKDAGQGVESIAAYHKTLDAARAGNYHDPHLEFAYYGLGESLRGQRQFNAAAQAYQTVLSLPHPNPVIRLRALLAAGEVYDVLRQRDAARKMYQSVIDSSPNSDQAAAAHKYLEEPYRIEN